METEGKEGSVCLAIALDSVKCLETMNCCCHIDKTETDSDFLVFFLLFTKYNFCFNDKNIRWAGSCGD